MKEIRTLFYLLESRRIILEPEYIRSEDNVIPDRLSRILDLGLSTSDTRTLRACTSAVLDFVFFKRAVSGHLLLLGDVTIADDVLVFREHRTKGSR